MKPVHQTAFAGITEQELRGTITEESPVGNCFQAAIASLLELELEQVPHFVKIDLLGGKNWLAHADEWLADRGYEFKWLHAHEVPPHEYVMVHGRSPRGYWAHVVIYINGRLVHDPHPSGDGILTQDHFCVIRKMA